MESDSPHREKTVVEPSSEHTSNICSDMPMDVSGDGGKGLRPLQFPSPRCAGSEGNQTKIQSRENLCPTPDSRSLTASREEQPTRDWYYQRDAARSSVCARHCSERSTCITSSEPHTHHRKYITSSPKCR